jgi:PAT family beta-lactamase induction signal transducer AmpG
MLGCALIAVWLIVLITNATGLTNWAFNIQFLEWGALFAIGGILFGGLLDYLALRKTALV